MLNEILHTLLLAFGSSVILFFIKATYTALFNTFFDPILAIFWHHALHFGKGTHPTRSPLKCSECDAALRNTAQ